MPKITTDYSKTIMYKIVCNDLNVKECYVGHTINMTKRKYRHKSSCNNEKNKAHNFKIYQIIRQNGGWSNWSMILVEEFPCKDKYQACKRERELYEELDAKMNTFRPYLTQEERTEEDKKYREEHKAEIIQNSRKYREKNKEEIKEKTKQYREDHKEEIRAEFKQYCEEHRAEFKQYSKKYREKNKEKIAEKNKEKIECEFCSKLLSKGSMYRHIKTCKSKPVKNYIEEK